MSIDLLHQAITDAEAALAKVKSIAASLFGQAETDAVQVGETAVTSGLAAAEVQAVGDATKLGGEAVTELKGAVAEATTSTLAPSTTPAPAAPVADVTTPRASA